ncbi:MAG: hypothetical protein J3Q66DRAFT_446030 [Benniella sp.]|nr:MAG: hypothetical protein J3Q66DRAFT_446030 [Benniella sp.]
MATATIHAISNRKMRKEILNPTLPLLQQCADLSLIGSHETRIIARVLNAFCLQFQRADIFWNELSTVVLEMESLLRRVISSPFRHSLLKSLIRYNDEAVDSLDCLARMRLFAIMKGRSPRDSMMRMQLFNSMVSAIKRSGKVRAKFWKPLLSVARQEQRRSSHRGFQATLDLLEEVRKKNIMNHWTFLKHDGTTGKQEAHLDSLTHSTSHSKSLSSFTWVFSKPTTRHQSSGEAGNGCRRQRDRQSCKFVRKPDLGVEHSDAHRKWLQLNKTDEFYRRHIRHRTFFMALASSFFLGLSRCCQIYLVENNRIFGDQPYGAHPEMRALQCCALDPGQRITSRLKQIPQHVASESYNNVVWMQDFDRGQVAKTFSGDRITVSLTIVNCLRSLTQTWISQMRMPLAQDLDHDQGPQSRLDTARSGDLHTPQGFSREAQRVTYKAIINIQLYVGVSRVHQQLIKYSGEADFDDDSDSIVTDDTAFDADHFDDSTESSRCERLYNSAPSSRPYVDWDRINILGTELLNVLQTISRPLFGLDGYISADDSSCRYGVQHVLDNICSWYKSYQQEQGMLELDPADNDELPWKQGECLSEQSQDPDRTILIRAGRLCESTEPRMNPEEAQGHVFVAQEALEQDRLALRAPGRFLVALKASGISPVALVASGSSLELREVPAGSRKLPICSRSFRKSQEVPEGTKKPKFATESTVIALDAPGDSVFALDVPGDSVFALDVPGDSRKPQEVPRSPRRIQGVLRSPRRSPKAPGSSKKLQEVPKSPRKSQKVPGGPRKSQEAVRTPRRPRKPQEAPKRAQDAFEVLEAVGGANSSLNLTTSVILVVARKPEVPAA